MAGTSFSIFTPYTGERVERVVVAEMAAAGMDRDVIDPRHWHSADGLPYGYSLNQPDHETDPAGRPVLGRLAQRVAERTEGYVRIEDYAYLDAPAMATWCAHPTFHVVK